MVLAESVRLISQGQGLGLWKARESVCMWELIGLSPRHSAFCWHTAGTQLAIRVNCPSPFFSPSPPSSSSPTQPPYRMPNMHGKGSGVGGGGVELEQKKSKTKKPPKNISVNREEEGGSYDGAHCSQDPSGAWQEGIHQWQTGVPQQSQ